MDKTETIGIQHVLTATSRLNLNLQVEGLNLTSAHVEDRFQKSVGGRQYVLCAEIYYESNHFWAQVNTMDYGWVWANDLREVGWTYQVQEQNGGQCRDTTGPGQLMALVFVDAGGSGGGDGGRDGGADGGEGRGGG